MPEQQNITNIPSNRVEIIDPRTGMVSREWYRFFLNLFNLAGNGGNQTSLDDLQIGPPPQPDSGSGGGGGGTGTVTSVNMTVPTGLSVSGNPVTTAGTLAVTYTAGYAIPTTASQTNWDTAYSERLQWDGGSTNLVAATGRTSLGATTVGSNFLTLTNPSAITFVQINADNTITTMDAPTFRTAIGAGTGAGSVTSVSGAGTVSGLTLTGTVTTSGSLTLGGTLAVTPSDFSSQAANTFLAAPNGSAGVPTFRAIVAADVPTLNQNTTGSAATLTTGRTISISGDLTYTSPSFDGSANVTAAGTLATVNANVGSFTNASITVNGKGLITAASSGTAPVTSVTGTSPVVSSGGATPAISLDSGYGDTQNPYASKTANYVLAAPNGSAGVPTFRAIVAADIPTLNQNTTGTASNVTGTVAIANGGTGQTTAVAAFDALSPATTKGDLIVSNGTDNVRLAVGTDAYVLTADSTTASGIKWAAASGGGSNITSLGMWENNATISANYSITAGNNAMSAGRITVNSGVTVTVPTGSSWIVV